MYINISKVDFGKYYQSGSGGGGVTPEPEPGQGYLCFTSTGDSTVELLLTGSYSGFSKKIIQYKINNGEWNNFPYESIPLLAGDKMYIKSDNTLPLKFENTGADDYSIAFAINTGKITVSGDITSLYNFDYTINIPSKYSGIFKNCTAITNALDLKLPDTTLSNKCYQSMFEGCTSLVQAPALPATTLVEGCYSSMFEGCTSLINAPELPATTLESYCYASMFNGCTKLNHVKALFTDKSAEECLSSWLDNVSPTGTFVKNSAATWTNEQAGIPTGWTVQTASPDK